MSADLHALRFFAGWVNRHQQRAIEYLVEENRARFRDWQRWGDTACCPVARGGNATRA
jgi:hypothetical protein